MEKIKYYSSSDQSIYPYNTTKIGGPMMAHSSENYAPSINQGGGGMLYAPFRSLSYSSYPQIQHQQQPQPPLLPLPITTPYSLNRGLSCPPVNRRINNRTKQPKKSKPSITTPKTDGSRKFGPDPKDLPKVVSRALSSEKININAPDYSDSIMFNISPPPSSLPLPTFFLKPRMNCKVEAAAVEVDAGATDSLRRMLRLR